MVELLYITSQWNLLPKDLWASMTSFINGFKADNQWLYIIIVIIIYI